MDLFFLNFLIVICFLFSSCDLLFFDVLCIHGFSVMYFFIVVG